MTFWMAMILNPSIQKKAQAELDAVVGKDRLPTNKDKADLPYIRSIMAEVARWAPPVPLCLSYLLSKNSLIKN
jgi:cytochrome P450